MLSSRPRVCRGRFAFAALTIALLVGSDGYAATVAYEGFEYENAAGAQLLGKNGGLGFASPWEAEPEVVGDALRISDDSLDFPGLGTSGNAAMVPETSEGSWLVRELASSVSTEENRTLYLSFLLRGEQGSETAPEGYFGLVLFGDSEDTALFVGHRGGGGPYVLEDFGGTRPHASPVVPVRNETALFVVKADLMAGIDTFTLYVNPIAGEEEPDDGIVKSDSDILGLDGIIVAGDAGFSIDEIRIGDTFADVTPVPEPNSILLAAVGLGVVLFRTGIAC